MEPRLHWGKRCACVRACVACARAQRSSARRLTSGRSSSSRGPRDCERDRVRAAARRRFRRRRVQPDDGDRTRSLPPPAAHLELRPLRLLVRRRRHRALLRRRRGSGRDRSGLGDDGAWRHGRLLGRLRRRRHRGCCRGSAQGACHRGVVHLERGCQRLLGRVAGPKHQDRHAQRQPDHQQRELPASLGADLRHAIVPRHLVAVCSDEVAGGGCDLSGAKRPTRRRARAVNSFARAHAHAHTHACVTRTCVRHSCPPVYLCDRHRPSRMIHCTSFPTRGAPERGTWVQEEATKL